MKLESINNRKAERINFKIHLYFFNNTMCFYGYKKILQNYLAYTAR